MTDAKPKRIQRKRTKGWRMPEGARYVGRPTRYGNPWRVFNTSYGWMVQDRVRNWYPSSEAVARRFARFKFRQWLKTSEFAQRRVGVEALRGSDLACWCPLDHACHVDVLLELANKELPDD